MPDVTYIDTSVLAAYYCPEPLSGLAEDVVLAAEQPAISVLTDVELHSALSRKVREGALACEDARRIATQFRLHIDDRLYTFLPLGVRHHELARDWLARFDTPLRTLDALHLAVAADADAVLLTADRCLAMAAGMLGLAAELIG